MTLLFHDKIFLRHDTGEGHPERAERLRVTVSHLEKIGLLDQCTRGTLKPLPVDQIAQVHDKDYIAFLKKSVEDGGGRVEADTIVSPDSFLVAQIAAGAAVEAVDQVIRGRHQNAFCLVRPPGHHALKNKCMGFCLFNSVALAATLALINHQLNRVLIVDWDVHHGNGTQDIFYDDPRVTFLSLHRFPFYPGSGTQSETGSGAGLGHTINEPIEFGTSRRRYVEIFRSALDRALKKSNPELILVSAGFDAHKDDPIGSLGLEEDDFQTLTQIVIEAAQTHCDAKIVSLLEGGYNVEALSNSAEVHLRELIQCDHKQI